MVGQRRIATEKQVIYANAISKTLGLECHFDDGDLLCRVGRFIKHYEQEYKENVDKQLATPRQIDYANIISDTLNIGKTFDSQSLKREVNEFINKNKELYDETWMKKKFVSGNTYKYEDFDGTLREKFPTKCREFMYDNLYRVHGVYAFLDIAGNVAYIGKSVNLAQRIPSSYRERSSLADIRNILYYVDENIANINVLEIIMISKYKPELNYDCKTLDDFTLFDCGIDISNFKELRYFNSEKGGVSNE